jgi:hypothetical protein
MAIGIEWAVMNVARTAVLRIFCKLRITKISRKT